MRNLLPLLGFWRDYRASRDFWAGHKRPTLNHLREPKMESLMGTTSDRSDPRLTHGADTEPTGQAPVYLVLSDEERAKGFVRPVRRTYVHRYMFDGSRVPVVLTGREVVGGCGAATTMSQAIAETYARDPGFYSSTYCAGCKMHLRVGQFHWDGDFETVGS